MTEQELIEKLAEKEHEGWTRYMAYLISKFARGVNGDVVLPAAYVEALKRQIDTPYAELAPHEQQYDRDEVAHILPIIGEYLAAQAPIPTFTMYVKCPSCGINHDPAIACFKLSDGTVALNFPINR